MVLVVSIVGGDHVLESSNDARAAIPKLFISVFIMYVYVCVYI